MRWRGVLKDIAIFVLIVGSIIVLWFGLVQTLFGRPWMRLGGLLMAAGGFSGVLLVFDLMWGRPPAFSKGPWERDSRRPPGY